MRSEHIMGANAAHAMAAAHASGCMLVPLHGNIFRRIGYLRARRHFVSRPMREFVAWLRALTSNEAQKASCVRAV